MRKVKPITSIETEYITLVPSLVDGELIPAHEQLAVELYPHYNEWFFDPYSWPNMTEADIIFNHINHLLSFVCWSNRAKKPIAFIIGTNEYGPVNNPLILDWNILALPEFGKEAYLGMVEAINWIFKNTNVHRIQSEVPREICSKDIYERLGFTDEGTRRNAIIYKGKPIHTDMMGLLKSDWNNQRSKCFITKNKTIQLLVERLKGVVENNVEEKVLQST